MSDSNNPNQSSAPSKFHFEEIVSSSINSPLVKLYSIKFPRMELDSAVESRLLKMQPSYLAKGFRKGKVPISILRAIEGQKVFSEELDKLCGQASKELIQRFDLRIAEPGKVEIKKIDQEGGVELSIEFELFPKLPEIDFSNLEIADYELSPTEEEIQGKIDNILRNYREWQEITDQDYPASRGNLLKIDYVGKIDGVAFEGGSATGADLEIGSKIFIDNFEEQLIGKKVGDEILVKVRFPNNYHKKELSDREAEFDVKIKKISKQKDDLESLKNDNFVKEKLGFETFEDLKREIVSMETELSDMLFSRLQKKQINQYLENYLNFDLPPKFIKHIEDDIKNNTREGKNELKNAEEGDSIEKSKKFDKALKNLRTFLLFNDLTKKFEVEILPEDWEKEAKKLYRVFGEAAKGIFANIQKNQSAYQERSQAISEYKLVKQIIKKAKAIKTPISIAEFNELSKSEVSD